MEAAIDSVFLVRTAWLFLFPYYWWTCSLRDIQRHDIPHRVLGQMTVLAALGYFLLARGTFLAGRAATSGPWYHWGFYRDAMIHAALCLAAAQALWWFKIWPAGDAKLFTVLGAAAPLIRPGGRFFPGLEFLVLLINIFVPAALYILGREAWKLGRLWWEVRGRHSWNFLRALPAGGLAEFLWVRRALAKDPLAEAGRTVAASLAAGARFATAGIGLQLALAGRWPAVQRYWQILWLALGFGLQSLPSRARRWVYLAGASAVAGEVVLGSRWNVVKASASPGLFIQWSMAGLVIAALSGLYRKVAGREDVIHVPRNLLRPYIVLTEKSRRLIEADEDLADRHFSAWYPDGLTPSQSEALKAWCVEKDVAILEAHRPVHFAFWIFFGFAAALALDQDVASVFWGLLGRL